MTHRPVTIAELAAVCRLCAPGDTILVQTGAAELVRRALARLGVEGVTVQVAEPPEEPR